MRDSLHIIPSLYKNQYTFARCFWPVRRALANSLRTSVGPGARCPQSTTFVRSETSNAP